MAVNNPYSRMRSDDQFDPGQHICVQNHTITKCDIHWHNYFEIEIITAGTGIHILNGTEYPVREGSTYLLTPTDFHELIADTSIELINISFDEEVLTEKILSFCISASTGRMLQFDGDDYHRITMAACLLQHECQTDGPCKQQLCEYLLSCLLRSSGTAFQDAVQSEHLNGINRAVLYLQLHFREPVTLAGLAEQAGFHPTYFSELFRKITGETYIERLQQLRINYARRLLADGFCVSDACFASGFGSLSNFLTTFKKRCGMTPSEYRAIHSRTDPVKSGSNQTTKSERTCRL